MRHFSFSPPHWVARSVPLAQLEDVFKSIGGESSPGRRAQLCKLLKKDPQHTNSIGTVSPTLSTRSAMAVSGMAQFDSTLGHYEFKTEQPYVERSA